MIVAFNKNPLTDGKKKKLAVYSNDLENRIEDAFISAEAKRFQHTIKATSGSGNTNITLPFTISGEMDVVNGKVFIGTSLSQEYNSGGAIQNTITGASINASIRYGNTVTVHWELGRNLQTGRHAYIYILVMYFE